MKASIFSIAVIAAFLAFSANAQHQHSGSASGSSSDAVPRSNRNPSPGSLPPPGQGQGTRMGGQSGGHMMGGMGAGSMEGMFDQTDSNEDGVISREEWNAMHGAGASTESGGMHPTPHTPGGSR